MVNYKLQRVTSMFLSIATAVTMMGYGALKVEARTNHNHNGDDCSNSCRLKESSEGSIKLRNVDEEKYKTFTTNVYRYHNEYGYFDEHWTRTRRGNDDELLLRQYYYSRRNKSRIDVLMEGYIYDDKLYPSSYIKNEFDKVETKDYTTSTTRCDEIEGPSEYRQVIMPIEEGTNKTRTYYLYVPGGDDQNLTRNRTEKYYTVDCDGKKDTLIMEQKYKDGRGTFTINVNDYDSNRGPVIINISEEDFWHHAPHSTSRCNDDCYVLRHRRDCR